MSRERANSFGCGLVRVTLVGLLPVLIPAWTAHAGDENLPDEQGNADILYFEPVEGLTTVRHLAPRQTAIPLGLQLRLFLQAPLDAQVSITGAIVIGRNPDGVLAVCPLNQAGPLTIRGVAQMPDGTTKTSTCELNVVAIPISEIAVTVATPSVAPFDLGENATNERTMELYFGESIAALRPVAAWGAVSESGDAAPRRRRGQANTSWYSTSTHRTIRMVAAVNYAEFEPIMEWRVNGTAFALGSETDRAFYHTGTHSVQVGPPAQPAQLKFDTYRVSIVSHSTGVDLIAEDEWVTFEAVTDPPGFESGITWLSSTKYGIASPVVGQGPTFTVLFSDTIGLHEVTGDPLQWVGVKADNATFGQDQNCPPNCPGCTSDADCDDGDPCTNDFCDPPFCIHVPIPDCEVDSFCSTGTITVTIFPGVIDGQPNGFTEDINLSSEGLGDAVVVRTAPPFVDCFDGGCIAQCSEIPTEMVNLELAGTSPILGDLIVREREDRVSDGGICCVDTDQDGNFLSGDSYFNIFVEIEVPGEGITLDTGKEPVRLQAEGITSLPPFGQDYFPQPPVSGVCGQPGGPQTIPLFLAGTAIQVGDLTHALHKPCACTISITKMTGARKTTVGDFAQLPDPHDPGRLFLDTIEGGVILADSDKQNVELEVQVGPPTLDPTKYEVLWEVRDPDDPADHMDVDANDGGTVATPLGTLAKGGDNIDPKPEETTDGQHFFRMASHPIGNRASPGSDGNSAATVIGKATTQLTADLKSTVKFHYGDEGGDNYIITAICVKKANQAQEASDSTGTQTVWRKRFFKVNAMVKTADDMQAIAPGTAGANANSVNVNPGVNTFADSYLQDDDKYTNNSATHVRVGADVTSDTTANNGGVSYYPGANLAGVLAALRSSYASATANRACYVDPVPSDLSLATTYKGLMTEATGANINTDEHKYAQNETAYHGGAGNNTHPDNTYHILGIRTFGVVTGSLGTSVIDPHSYINLLSRYQTSEQGGNTAVGLSHTTVHELGHSIVPETVDNIHVNHSAVPHNACCGTVGTLDVQWCPAHARQIRENVTRAWANHDPTIANPADTARDSD